MSVNVYAYGIAGIVNRLPIMVESLCYVENLGLQDPTMAEHLVCSSDIYNRYTTCMEGRWVAIRICYRRIQVSALYKIYFVGLIIFLTILATWHSTICLNGPFFSCTRYQVSLHKVFATRLLAKSANPWNTVSNVSIWNSFVVTMMEG